MPSVRLHQILLNRREQGLLIRITLGPLNALYDILIFHFHAPFLT